MAPRWLPCRRTTVVLTLTNREDPMNDNPQPPSGSRWEHSQDDEPTAEQSEQSEQPDASETEAAAESSTEPSAVAEPAGRRAWGSPESPRRGPSRVALLVGGGALGLVLVAGTGGYALGHATGDGDRGPEVSRTGGDDGRGGWDDHGRGHGGLPPDQTQPDQTQPDEDAGADDGAITGSVT